VRGVNPALASTPDAAGMGLDAPTGAPTIRGNRVWDTDERKTQTTGCG
jgi:hypothetical protein